MLGFLLSPLTPENIGTPTDLPCVGPEPSYGTGEGVVITPTGVHVGKFPPVNTKYPGSLAFEVTYH